MFTRDLSKNSIEVLEARIAPAGVSSGRFVPAITGSPILLHAGDVLTTGGKITIPGVGDVGSGAYLLYVEKGDALVFTTDLNNNKVVDFNEITGIAAGDGLRITCFADIYGDIVTNLNPNTTLSDSNNFAGDDDPLLKGDGRVVLNNTIEKIEMRSLALGDVLDENGDGDTTEEVIARLVLTSYSIHGNVYAGKQFGVTLPDGSADIDSGLIIDDAGRALMTRPDVFNTARGPDFYDDGTRPITPTVGFIRTGSAVSGEWFTFGISSKHDVQGYLANFSAPPGQVGGDIASIRTADPTTAFDLAGLVAGDGGIGARGGNVIAATLHGDTTGGYIVKAGNGGRGPTGGAGGSIIDFQDLSGVNNSSAGTGQIIIQSGDGGVASTGGGGNGGVVNFGTMTVNGGLAINLGSGGDGFVAGGNGASLATAEIVTPEGKVQFGSNNIGSTHVAPLKLRSDGFPVTGKLDASAYGSIGRHIGIDFDHDGAGDIVSTSSDPNEVTIVFGDGFGFVRTDMTSDPTALPGRFFRLYVDAPINPDAVTVADFNHDGFEDIAVGSNNPGNFGGVYVFLAKTEDTNDDGILSVAEDLDRDGVVDFLGFRTARQSFLPALNTFDPDDPNLTLIFGDYKRSAVPIVDLEAGDFDGDGYTDLAVLATYLFPAPPRNPQVNPNQVIMFMHPDIENGRPTGQFYADFGTQRVVEPPKGANPFIPFIDIGGETAGVIQATALTADGASFDPVLTSPLPHDVIVGATIGAKGGVIVDNSVPSRLGPLSTGFGWGAVDTDRLIGGGHFAPVVPTLRDFAVVDSIGEQFTDLPNAQGQFNNILDGEPYIDVNGNGIFDPGEPFTDNNPANGQYDYFEPFSDINGNGFFDPFQDGLADISLITEAPTGFMVSLGSSSPFTFFDFNVVNLGTDNGGTFFGGPPGGGFDLTTDVMAIRDANTDGTGFAPDDMNDNVAVLIYNVGGAPITYEIMELDIADRPPPDVQGNPGATNLVTIPGIYIGGATTSIVSFDTFYAIADDPTLTSYIVASPFIAPNAFHFQDISGDLFGGFYPISEHFIKINSGNGGAGLVGKGGAGGFLGGGLTLTTTTDPNTGLTTTDLKGSLSITLPANLAYEGDVVLTAGDGGNGFSDGGIGGNITGTTVRFSPARTGSFSTTVHAGDGGFGVGGKGGDGGDLRSNSFDQGFQLEAGNGGRGRIGGAGGDIIGNGFAGFYDSNAITQELVAGFGGNGVKAGGNGGNIHGYHGDHSGRVVGSPGTELEFAL